MDNDNVITARITGGVQAKPGNWGWQASQLILIILLTLFIKFRKILKGCFDFK